MTFTKQLSQGILLLLVLLALDAQAQQPNFSLYHYTPFFTNPGTIGVEQDVRLMLNYRNQTVETGDNFRTSSLSGYYPVQLGNHRLVVAGNFMNDQASDGLSTNGGLLGAAYSIRLSTRSALSLGVQAGLFQRRVSDDFTTDDQFVDGVFDPNRVSRDALLGQTKTYPALSSGLHYLLRDGEGREKAFLGAALFNATEPDISLLEEGADRLSPSVRATAGYRVYQGLKFSVLPTARWVSQAGNTFLNVGSRFGYELGKTADGVKKIDLGLWYNTNDLGVFSLAYEQPGLVVGVSYDLPVGDDLGAAQNGIIELAVAFRLKKKRRPHVPQTVPATLPREEEENTAEVETVDHGNEERVIDEQIVQNPVEEQPSEVIREELEEEDEPLSAEEQEVLDSTVRFRLNSDQLTGDSRAFLDRVYDILKEREGLNIALVGHTCSLGSEKLNADLSLKRARQVQQYLVEKGLVPARFIVKGAGESQPLDRSETEEARLKNRRVEFKVVKK